MGLVLPPQLLHFSYRASLEGGAVITWIFGTRRSRLSSRLLEAQELWSLKSDKEGECFLMDKGARGVRIGKALRTIPAGFCLVALRCLLWIVLKRVIAGVGNKLIASG